MTACLHTANIPARGHVYSQQLDLAPRKCDDGRMKLRLKELRSERKLTIDQLADLSGLSRGYISLLENDRRKPSADALELLAQALRIRVTDLIEEGEASGELTTLMLIMESLSPEDRQAVLREAASRLPRRAI